MKLVYTGDSKSVAQVGGWWRVSIADPLRVKQMLSHEVDRVCEEREGFEPSVRSICCGVRVRVSPSACLSQTDSWCCPTTNFFLSRNDPPHTLLPKQARNGVVYECCLQAWHQQLFFESQWPPVCMTSPLGVTTGITIRGSTPPFLRERQDLNLRPPAPQTGALITQSFFWVAMPSNELRLRRPLLVGIP